jgi:hypothetical protein
MTSVVRVPSCAAKMAAISNKSSFCWDILRFKRPNVIWGRSRK